MAGVVLNICTYIIPYFSGFEQLGEENTMTPVVINTRSPTMSSPATKSPEIITMIPMFFTLCMVISIVSISVLKRKFRGKAESNNSVYYSVSSSSVSNYTSINTSVTIAIEDKHHTSPVYTVATKMLIDPKSNEVDYGKVDKGLKPLNISSSIITKTMETTRHVDADLLSEENCHESQTSGIVYAPNRSYYYPGNHDCECQENNAYYYPRMTHEMKQMINNYAE